MEERFLILDITEHQSWGPVRAVQDCPPLDRPLGIPANCRPTVLQVNRQVAEREILRLAEQSPGHTFALFELTHVSAELPLVTHLNLHGQPLKSRTVHRLLPVALPPAPPIRTEICNCAGHATTIAQKLRNIALGTTGPEMHVQVNSAELLAVLDGLEASDARDAAHYRRLRNLPDADLGRPGVPCIAVPTGPRSGNYVNGVDADAALEAA